MNVSSVKNLNGEVFSAVQDASLTNVVQTNSASWGAGSTPTYDYTDNNLISAIDTSGLYASSGSANHLIKGGTMGANIIQNRNASNFYFMPINSPWTTADVATGIFSPLQYTTGACLGMDDGYFKAYFKGNEWFVGNTAIGQALRGEVHGSRGVHISGATTAGYSFDLNISAVSGKNDTANNYNWKLERGCVSGKSVGGEWRYGPAEDTLLRSVSSNYLQEVSHDNTLSGNGTVDSPLGVVPGYNETVLWSGSLTWGQTAALSDSVKNYDRVRFYIEETNRHRKATNELVLTDLSNADLREFALNMQDATTSYFGNYFTVYDINEVGDSLTSVSGRQWWYSPWTATGINGSPDRGLILTRVIGINRIANN